MGKVIGFIVSSLVVACLAIVALPIAIVMGVLLLVLACLGAGSALAVLGAFVIAGVVVCAVLLHLALHLIVPVLVICGIVYLIKRYNARTA